MYFLVHGQDSTQAAQDPHCDSSTGMPVSRGASVSAVVSQTAEPKGFVITRALTDPSRPRQRGGDLVGKSRPEPHLVELLRHGL